MNAHQLINQTSGKTEYYTDPRIVEAARRVCGPFTIDPASSEKANAVVKAERIFTAPQFWIRSFADDGLPFRTYGAGGLKESWYGTVWMNHPFGSPERACRPSCTKNRCTERGYHLMFDRPGNDAWIDKLVDSYEVGHIFSACCITFASTSEKWFRPLLDYPQCYLYGRNAYVDPVTGKISKGATKGSVVTYFGRAISLFREEFEDKGLGKVKV